MNRFNEVIPGLLLSFVIAAMAFIINSLMPIDLIGSALIALLTGMAFNPIISKHRKFDSGIKLSSKLILKTGIILAGIALSFAQVFEAGKYALLLLVFTFLTAFGVGYLCQKLFKIDWKLANLLSCSTAICGGTAVATVGPVIKADDKEIAYAISATFIFDLLTVLMFPFLGVLMGLSDTGYGLWVGTSVNDTSSVVAAGYAFSEAAGALATIVKLTRTLFIVPIVIYFSFKLQRKNRKHHIESTKAQINILKIFPWFILGFLLFVGIRTANILTPDQISFISNLSKFFMATALASIGLKTSFSEVKSVGVKPMIAAIVIDLSVVVVSLIVQGLILTYL